MKFESTLMSISTVGIAAIGLLVFYQYELTHIEYISAPVPSHTHIAHAAQAVESLSQTPEVINKTRQGVLLHNVPFTVQAPLGEWTDNRLQDGCEEASSIMIMHWLNNKESISAQYAKEHIIALSDWQQDVYGTFHDTSTDDTLERIIKTYFKYDDAFVLKHIESADTIVAELEKNSVVMTPVNGHILKNKYYSGLGPPRHMITIIGYDYSTQEFIAHDPGTRNGGYYRYSADTLFAALQDYGTGKFQDLEDVEKNIIVVRKNS